MSVLSIALMAFLATVLVWWTQRARFNATSTPPSWLIVVVFVAGILALAFKHGWSRFLAGTGLKHGYLFPPTWFGVSFGISATFALVWFSTKARATLEIVIWDISPLGNIAWICAGLPMGIAAISFAVHHFTFAQRGNKDYEAKTDEAKTHEANADKANADKAKADKDKAWLQTDAPISDAADDRYDFGDMARRIGARLLKEPPPAQAILGGLGSGKTSLRGLTQQYVKSRPHKRRIEFVNIELWPYETPDAAVQGILRQLTRALAKEIDTARLDGLPNAYLDAITKTSGLSNILPQAASRARTPASVLDEIDAMAKIIGRRYVLWVEDLERFAFGDPASEKDDASELSRLAPIRALLLGLDNAESFTVVTATTTLFQRFDLEKIARYVERIPDLPRETARQEIAKFRAARLNLVIDPAAKQRNGLGWHPQYDNVAFVRRIHGDAIVTFADAIAALASTPRVLKQALRRADETWLTLQGEIDIDDMIAMCLLREASPQAFALVENHVDRLRRRAPSARLDAQPVKVFFAELEVLSLEPTTALAIQEMVGTIFEKSNRRTQGLWHANHADYWQRFLVLPKIEPSLSDQAILRSISKQKSDEIIEILATPKAATAVQDFSDMFVSQHLQGLFLEYVEAHLDDDPGEWPLEEFGRHAPGMLRLWNALQARWRALDTAELAKDVQRSIELTAPKNLALLYEIDYWMLSDAVSVNEFEQTTADQLKTLVRTLLCKHYIGNPQALRTALKNVEPIVLSRLCWGTPHNGVSLNRALPFKEWPAFSKTISDALNEDPIIMSQQIVWMIANVSRAPDGSEKWTLNVNHCRALFEKPIDLIRRMTIAFENADELTKDSPTADGSLPASSNSTGDESIVRASLTPQAANFFGFAQTGRTVIEGFWFTHRYEFQGERPTYEPTGAVLVEGGLSLAGKTTCLDLEPSGNDWLPISETASSESNHWKAIAEKRESFFVPFDTWPHAYVATANGTASQQECLRRFAPEIVALADPDQPLVLLTLTDATTVDTPKASASPSDEAAPT
ncbi:MAG TPA: P-loop NTPase fold protein [Kofleriaceae bacterium]|nr:P-loop NTPase fold protein [Kofleriaceae bacterium]